jgi:hypothetical protein
MKNITIKSLLIAIMATSILTGCNSNDTDIENEIEATIEVETTEVETSTIEETPTEIETSTVEETPTEIETSTVEETTTEIETSTVEETPTEIETSTIEEYKTSEEETEDYTVEALNTTMYMNNNGRVRKGLSKDYEVIRTLSKGDAVQVTGKVKEADWYQVEIDNEKLYISGSLLSDTKPSDNNTTTTPSQTTPSTETPSTETPSTDGVYISPYDGSVRHPGDTGVSSDGSIWYDGGAGLSDW